MELFRPTVALAALLLTAACAPPISNLDPEPPPEFVDHACSEVWGAVPAGGRVYVDPDGDPEGDGSVEAPLPTLDAAITAARLGGATSVALTEGVFVDRAVLHLAEHAGMDLTGCGRALTSLEPPEDYADQPLVHVHDDADDVTVRDLALVGGRRALLIEGDVGADGPVVVERVTVTEPVRIGVVIAGPETVATLSDVLVEDPVVEEGKGWGISVQISAFPSEATMPAAPIVLEDVAVAGASGVGILVDGGWVQMADVEVTVTAPVDGELGRGLMLQQLAYGTLQGVTVNLSSDAGVFLHMPGRNGEPVSLVDCAILNTAAGLSDGEPTGDGLVIGQGGEPVAAEEFPVVVSGSSIGESARTAVLAEGVHLTLADGNSLGGEGTDYPVVAGQAGALIDAAGDVQDLVEMLDEGDELSMLRDPLELDDVSDVE